MNNALTETAKEALLLIASRDGGGSSPVRASELEQSDLNELCAAGCVCIYLGSSVTLSVSPVGCDAVDAIRRERGL